MSRTIRTPSAIAHRSTPHLPRNSSRPIGAALSREGWFLWSRVNMDPAGGTRSTAVVQLSAESATSSSVGKGKVFF
jgi:hypothetical protein